MSPWQAWIEDVVFSFRKQKDWAEQAFGQLSDEEFFAQPAEQCNSVALIVKHVAGNLKSRWTDFLTTDGEKPWRNRDDEFLIGPGDTRERLLAAWEDGWRVLLKTLAGLGEADLLRKLTIRNEQHTVMQATHRSLTHVAYHTGQILYVAHLMKKEGWRWITIPPGQSERARAKGGNYLK
jgi:uncharacterized damage-inducible protein DinB